MPRNGLSLKITKIFPIGLGKICEQCFMYEILVWDSVL